MTNNKWFKVGILAVLGIVLLAFLIMIFSPRDAKTYLSRGYIYWEKGNYKKALKAFNKAIDMKPDFAEAYVARSLIYDRQNNDSHFLDDFFYAKKFDPYFSEKIEIKDSNPAKYLVRGFVYIHREKRDETLALADFTRAVEIKPDFAEAYYIRGSMEDDNNAIADFTKAIEIDPHYSDPHYARGDIYSKQNKYIQAIDDYKEAIQKGISDRYRRGILETIGNIYIEMQNYKESLVYYKKVLEIDPNNKDAKDAAALLEKSQQPDSTDKDFKDFYDQITFPLEMSDKPVRAIYYNGNINIDYMDKLSSEMSNWKPLRTDFISPTCVRYIYSSTTGNGNMYCLYFVNKNLRLASLFRKEDDWQSSNQQDMQMLTNVDPSLFQEAQMDKQRKFEMYKTIMAQDSGSSNQVSNGESLVDIYTGLENARQEQDYRNKMIDLQKQQLEIMRNQGNNSYNTNCYANGSNINCTTN